MPIAVVGLAVAAGLRHCLVAAAGDEDQGVAEAETSSMLQNLGVVEAGVVVAVPAAVAVVATRKPESPVEEQAAAAVAAVVVASASAVIEISEFVEVD